MQAVRIILEEAKALLPTCRVTEKLAMLMRDEETLAPLVMR